VTIHLGDLPEGCLTASGPLIPSVRSCFECRAADRRRRRSWCALTAPFHPCLIATEVAPSAVCSLLHGMSGFPDLARASTLSFEVPTFLNRALSAQLRSPDRLAVGFKATAVRAVHELPSPKSLASFVAPRAPNPPYSRSREYSRWTARVLGRVEAGRPAVDAVGRNRLRLRPRAYPTRKTSVMTMMSSMHRR